MIDVFGGTGVVSAELLDITKKIIINDFLYSNEVIYRAFFGKSPYDYNKLLNYVKEFNSFDKDTLKPNYVSENYGNRYFNYQDAKLIGYIRQKISDMYDSSEINQREFDILLASLLYSFDKCANTVGHYEAYIKGNVIRSRFSFDLIEPIKTDSEIEIYREDSNDLARRIKADMAFIDPPYNSRQYSRFYHVLETIVKWDKPILIGTAKKPPEENMSDYCRNSAPRVFAELIESLNVKYSKS